MIYRTIETRGARVLQSRRWWWPFWSSVATEARPEILINCDHQFSSWRPHGSGEHCRCIYCGHDRFRSDALKRQ